MVEYEFAVIGERLKEAIYEAVRVCGKDYEVLLRSTCKRLHEAYIEAGIRSAIPVVNLPGTRPRIGGAGAKHDVSGVIRPGDETSREEPIMEYRVNLPHRERILNEALSLGCTWAHKERERLEQRE